MFNYKEYDITLFYNSELCTNNLDIEVAVAVCLYKNIHLDINKKYIIHSWITFEWKNYNVMESNISRGCTISSILEEKMKLEIKSKRRELKLKELLNEL